MPSSAKPKPLTAARIRHLETKAKVAARASYSPYSRFAVGAALLTAGGDVFAGCNVENASFGLCNCAERTAIFSAVASGKKGSRQLECIVVYTPTEQATMPCGACRQVINEFGPDARVISVCDSADRVDTTLSALLPGAFGPADLA